MQNLIGDIKRDDTLRKEAIEERKKEANKHQEGAPVVDHGTIEVNGKSLGRFTAAVEENEGQAYTRKNPEDVVLGGKREDWH